MIEERSPYTRAEKLGGFFLLLSLISAAILILVIGQGRGWFARHYPYLVRFPQSYNLQPGAAVKMFNTEIGKVTGLRITRFRDENQVVVTLLVKAEYRDLIRLDSVAVVESPTILGSEYLSISPGTYGYPPIEPHGTIPSRAKKTLADYLEELQPEETLQKAKQFVANLTYLSERLKEHEQKLLTTLNNFDAILETLLQAKGSLGELLVKKDFYHRLDQAANRIENILKNSEVLTKNLRQASEEVPGLAQGLGQELAKVKVILADLERASGKLPDLLETTDEAARSGRDVLGALKANPLIRWTLPTPPRPETIRIEPRYVP